MNLNFKDKIVIVVGGTKGIGLAISKSFLSENAIVHIISRAKNAEIENNLNALYKNQVFFHLGDSTCESELKIISKKIKNFDILISNVGNGKSDSNPINESNVWDASWNTNFNSALNSVRVFSPNINNGGVITFISSIAGIENIGAPTEYSVAKSAINTFSKILSHKLAPKIRVNTIVPGNIYFKNGIWDIKINENPEQVSQMLEANVPLKRFGNPEEVADLVIFISSAKATFITGACITIDGGQTKSF
jgi:3-oxoacyl-[acyl-carrier protein] reductase